MFGGQMRVLEVFGDSADIGRAHGEACSTMIRKYVDDRLGLSAQERWSGGDVHRDLILELSERSLPHHERYAPDLYSEMITLAEAAEITPAEAVVVGGFTDVVDIVRAEVGEAPLEHNCTAVINPREGFYAQTWDMHASAGEYVLMLKIDPLMGPPALVQTTAGCLGQMGMNEAGISIGINNLTSIGKVGVTWPFVVRKALEQTDFDAAVDAVMEADLAGGHNFMLMGPDSKGVNIEAMPLEKRLTIVDRDPFVHSNHCLDPATAREHGPREREHVENSDLRLEIGRANTSSPEAFFEDPEISRRAASIEDVATCGAVVMVPASRTMRAVWGVPGENPWQSFSL